ncbi:hypothetical protein ACWCXX_06935 [Streptomyces sp. NPDC001732]
MFRHAIAPSARFTLASHDVVRHSYLNSDAKILVLYVQGLPEGALNRSMSEIARKLGIKGRAYQKVKQQLIEHGFVHEWRSQADRGRWATERLVANVPLTSEQAASLRGTELTAPSVTPPAASPTTPPPSAPFPAVGEPAARTVGGYEPVEDHSDETTPHPPSEAEPKGSATDPALSARAERLLLSLRHSHRELHLGVREARNLVPAAVKWLERGLSEADLRHALLAERPASGVRSAVGFLRHRLIQKLPEPQVTLRPHEPSPVRELLECEGPGEKHVFRPLADETECAPCRRRSVTRTTPASEQPVHIPWRERLARIKNTSAALPSSG